MRATRRTHRRAVKAKSPLGFRGEEKKGPARASRRGGASRGPPTSQSAWRRSGRCGGGRIGGGWSRDLARLFGSSRSRRLRCRGRCTRGPRGRGCSRCQCRRCGRRGGWVGCTKCRRGRRTWSGCLCSTGTQSSCRVRGGGGGVHPPPAAVISCSHLSWSR
jgi:hypothetical protein